jgi:hypothetical protein
MNTAIQLGPFVLLIFEIALIPLLFENCWDRHLNNPLLTLALAIPSIAWT